METTRVVNDKVRSLITANSVTAKLISIDKMNSMAANKSKYQATTSLTKVSETTKKIVKNEQIDLKKDSGRPDFDFNLDVVKVKYQFKELSLSNISLDEESDDINSSSHSKEV